MKERTNLLLQWVCLLGIAMSAWGILYITATRQKQLQECQERLGHFLVTTDPHPASEIRKFECMKGRVIDGVTYCNEDTSYIACQDSDHSITIYPYFNEKGEKINCPTGEETWTYDGKVLYPGSSYKWKLKGFYLGTTSGWSESSEEEDNP